MRVTHLPTRLSADCHGSRSSHRNHENALRLLRGMVWLRRHPSACGDVALVRSYSLYPFRVVVDQCGGMERHDVEAVLGGGLDVFLRARLGASE